MHKSIYIANRITKYIVIKNKHNSNHKQAINGGFGVEKCIIVLNCQYNSFIYIKKSTLKENLYCKIYKASIITYTYTYIQSTISLLIMNFAASNSSLKYLLLKFLIRKQYATLNLKVP